MLANLALGFTLKAEPQALKAVDFDAIEKASGHCKYELHDANMHLSDILTGSLQTISRSASAGVQDWLHTSVHASFWHMHALSMWVCMFYACLYAITEYNLQSGLRMCLKALWLAGIKKVVSEAQH